MPTGTQEHARGMLETAKKSSHFWAFAYVQEVEPLLDRLQRVEAVVEVAKAGTPLAEQLADLIVREDIPDEDLQDASETLLPKIHDYFLRLNDALAAWEEGKGP